MLHRASRRIGAWPRWGGGWYQMIALGLVGSTEGCHESRRCSRDTYPESYITKYTSPRRLKVAPPKSVIVSRGGRQVPPCRRGRRRFAPGPRRRSKCRRSISSCWLSSCFLRAGDSSREESETHSMAPTEFLVLGAIVHWEVDVSKGTFKS